MPMTQAAQIFLDMAAAALGLVPFGLALGGLYVLGLYVLGLVADQAGGSGGE